MAKHTSASCLRTALLTGLSVWQALAGCAAAAESTEFWPEASVFVGLSPRTRIYLDAAYAAGEGSETQSMDLAAYLDVSLKPILRQGSWTEDWQRSRYFWARVGVAHIFKTASDTGNYRAEERGVVSLYGKAPLPAEAWLEARARVDFRLIGGDYSTRYRFRVEATRGFTVCEHAVVPYLSYEWFYDSRYDGLAQTLWKAGTEVTVNKHFRYEVYLAGQKELLPDDESIAAVGVAAKWFY